jgi:protein-S-isoprenylcysteine O-methyltransferase Ste14
MQKLELKIPPPAVAALIAIAIWGISVFTPSIEVSARVRGGAAVLLALTGAVVSILGIVSFRIARTTINPMQPETTTSLVCSGVYRLTRNPMYVGVLFVLVAWTIFLSSAWALLGPLAFVVYMNRFQIGPEERALSARFGAEYSNYKSKVRRWL